VQFLGEEKRFYTAWTLSGPQLNATIIFVHNHPSGDPRPHHVGRNGHVTLKRLRLIQSKPSRTAAANLATSRGMDSRLRSPYTVPKGFLNDELQNRHGPPDGLFILEAWGIMKLRDLAKLVAVLTSLIAFTLIPEYASAQIVAIGGSSVQGHGVSSSEAFPALLEGMLRAKGKSYSVSNQGVSGNTTSDVLARLDSAVPAGTRIVILMVGLNDIRGGSSVSQARAGYQEIVARLRQRQIRVIDANPYYRTAVHSGMVQSDHIHLSVEGHRYVASHLVSQIN
jgi:acyl-CoA thioesterase-1